MFKDLSFLKDKIDELNKIKYTLLKAEPFEPHTNNAIKFSSLGVKILGDNTNWIDYKKPLQPKRNWLDLIKTITTVTSLIFIGLSFYYSRLNNELHKSIEDENLQIDKLTKQINSYKSNNDTIKAIIHEPFLLYRI